MINASIAETHRFGRVRRNGYNPSEVDAVVARLTEALRHNDERIAALMERIDVADGTADAIRRTFIAAEATRDEIISDAETDAATIADQALSEAEELVETISEMRSEIAARRQSILADVYEDAEVRMLTIERQAAQRSADAEWAIRDAIDVRNRTVSDTEAETETILHRADGEAAQIRTRIAVMAQAAGALEAAAEVLAASTQDGARIIDLTAMEQLDESTLTAPAPTMVVMPGIGNEDKPLLIVSESTEDTDEKDEMPKTRYQRTTGIPLKERIKIARMSG
jgi:DivIVA domain-containing protein